MNSIKIDTEINSTIFFDTSSLKLFYGNNNDEFLNNKLKQMKLMNNESVDDGILPFYKSKVIRRLSINISNTCNLACKYCYANKGNYKKNDKMATTDELLEYLFPLLKTHHIHSIMFFGGEPCLNIDTIIDCCILLDELGKLDKINRIKSFGIVTNLYMSREYLDKIVLISRQFNFNITVSIDGPKYIHDKNRSLPNREGTYDKIRWNYLYLKSRGVNISIQCTYTVDHYKLEISPLKLLKHFENDFEVSNIHLAFESATRGSQRYLQPNIYMKDLCELFAYCILRRYKGKNISISYLDRILYALLNNKPIELYCPALVTDIAMDIDGKLYPCFMFFENRNFSFNNRNILNSKLLNKIYKVAKKDIGICEECWNKNLCFGCIAGDYIETMKISKKTKCNLMKSLTLEVILRTVELSMDIPYESLGTAYRYEDYNMISNLNVYY